MIKNSEGDHLIRHALRESGNPGIHNLQDLLDTFATRPLAYVGGILLYLGTHGEKIAQAIRDAEQGGWHRNMGADEWVFQYRGSRTIESEVGPVTIDEGEMSVIPRGVSHKNVGHGTNIEITIYARNPLRRMVPEDAEEARKRMKVKDGKPVMSPITLEDGEQD